MKQLHLPWTLHARLWLRSVVLPDLSRVAPLDRLLRWYTPRAVAPAWAALGPAEILRCIDAHLQGCPRMRGRRCLRRGLLAFYFLRLAGHPARLHFGAFVRPQGRTLAHCWTSVGPLIDDAPTAQCIELSTWDG